MVEAVEKEPHKPQKRKIPQQIGGNQESVPHHQISQNEPQNEHLKNEASPEQGAEAGTHVHHLQALVVVVVRGQGVGGVLLCIWKFYGKALAFVARDTLSSRHKVVAQGAREPYANQCRR